MCKVNTKDMVTGGMLLGATAHDQIYPLKQ